MEEMQIPLPQFYRKPTLLNSQTHADMRIAASPTGYAFSSSAQLVLLAGIEFFEASRQFPIIFSTTAQGKILPFALLGLEAEENLFVAPDGEWRGSYLPAYIRRYPFIHSQGDEQMAVCIDEAFEGFGSEAGERLFQAGEPSEKLRGILAFLQDYFQQMKKTERLCDRLQQLELLRPMDAQVSLNDGRNYTLSGLLVVDETKLNQLPDTEIVKLFRSGELSLLTAHLLSLKNLNLLMELKSAQASEQI